MKLYLLLASLAVSSIVQSQTLVANFSATPPSGCSPLVVNFKDLSTGNPSSWKWDFGNGTISYQQNPTATYFGAGNYTVTLVVKNATNSDSITRTQYIQVSALPVAKFGASSTTGCSPFNVQFTDSSTTSTGSIVSWQWDFGDGSSSSQQNPSHTYIAAGNYSVALWVTNNSGCVKFISRAAYIKTSAGAHADFNYSYVSGCTSPAQVSFNNNNSTGSGTLQHLWDFGDGSNSTQQNPVHNYINAGLYNAKLTATNSNGCTDTLVKTINVFFAKANFLTPGTICVDDNFAFTNTSIPSAANYLWKFNDGTSSTVSNPTKTYTTTGSYPVKLISDFGQCKDSITKNITIIGKPSPAFSSSNTIACKAPFTSAFTNSSTGGATYLWKFGDGTTSTNPNPTHTYLQTGYYDITLVATNAAGCSDSITKVDYIKIIPPSITGLNRI